MRAIPAILALAAACGGGPANRPDADPAGGDGGPDRPDGPLVITNGLVVTIRAVPDFPVALGGEFSALLNEQVFFDLREIRVIGDTAPGDERTYRDEVHVEWHCEQECEEDECECEPGARPVTLAFPDAPDGIYSSLLARVEGYRYDGLVTTDLERDFRIEEEPPEMDLVVSLPDVPLSAGGVTEISVAVSVGAPVLAVDWSVVTPDVEGKLELNQSSPQIDAVRDAVATSFTVTSVE